MSCCDAQKLFCPWCIPNLRSYFLIAVWKRKSFEFEFNSISCLWLRFIIVSCNYYFIKIIKPFLRIIYSIWNTRHIMKYVIIIFWMRILTNSQTNYSTFGRAFLLFWVLDFVFQILMNLVIIEYHAYFVPFFSRFTERCFHLLFLLDIGILHWIMFCLDFLHLGCIW